MKHLLVLASLYLLMGSSHAFSQKILMFASHEQTYYSEYIVMKEALNAAGYSVDVRSASSMDISIYLEGYTDIQHAANDLDGSTYSEFQSQFNELFGNEWQGDTYNSVPDFVPVDGSIMDVADFDDYVGMIVVGGTGALDYRVDGNYVSQGSDERLISAEVMQAVSEKLNELALDALKSGKPVMAQCHGASIPAFWRIPDTSGPGAEALGYSLIKGAEATGYPEEETGPTLNSLDITHQASHRVTITNPHSSFQDNGTGDGKIITTRDWYPQTVAYAARTFLNIIETYPSSEKLASEISVLVLHGGALDNSNLPTSCSPANRTNDIPCNNGTEEADLPADYTHLVELLENNSNDNFSINTTQLDLSESLPFSIDMESEILTELEKYDVVVFFKHWSTFISDELQNAMVTYVDNGGGMLALHHGLYNDIDGSQNKNILADQLFGAHSPQSGWSASLMDYTVYSTNYGHFISSYLIDYEDALAQPTAWELNSLPISANTGFSTLHSFEIYDELYNNMQFTNTISIGREVGEITPLFSNNLSTDEIAHTTAFTRMMNLNGDNEIGKLVYFQIGERKENVNSSGRFGQIVRNAVIWSARDKASTGEVLGVAPDEKVTIYPNPAAKHIRVVSEGVESISFFDSKGSFVVEIRVVDKLSNISELKDGLYLLRLNDASGKVIGTTQIIKSTY